MEKKSYSQLELFSEAGNPGQIKTQARAAFLGYVRAYEKAILVIIGAMVICIAAFSLGVEKGKKIAYLRYQSAPVFKASSAQAPVAPKETVVGPPAANVTQTAPIVIAPAVIKTTGNSQKFTIQIASYQNKTQAKKEAERLKKQVFSAAVMPKGKYNIVCIGNFSSMDAAKQLRLQLKKQYQDCYIRRL